MCSTIQGNTTTSSSDATLRCNETTESDKTLNVYLESAEFVFYAFIAVSGALTNSLAIGVILYHRHLRAMIFNLLIVYLAFVDFITCFISSFTTYWYSYVQFNSYSESVVNAVCLINVFIVNFSKLSSLTAMSEMAVLRVIGISRNADINQTLSRRGLTIMIFTNITGLILLSIYRTFVAENICSNPTSKHLWTNMTLASSFALLICVTYACIALYTKRKARKIAPERQGVRSYVIATTKTCLAISVCFIIFHLPFITYIVLVKRNVIVFDENHYTFPLGFIMFSSIGNPIVMYCTCTEFRKHVLLSFTSARRACKRSAQIGAEE